MPILEEELSEFADEWNSHRIRKQRNQLRPNGVPEDLYSFPELVGVRDMGYSVSDTDLESVAEEMGVGTGLPDYLSAEFREAADNEISGEFNIINVNNAKAAYVFLRNTFNPDV
ncbi:uncharacterized protein LOC144360579 [Saccoglossus kowalevskii]